MALATGKVIVTGGSGFIGTNVVEHYSRQGWEVLNLSDVEPRCPQHLPFWKQASILDAVGIQAHLLDFKPELLIHLGARTDLYGKTLEDYTDNVQGVQNVVNAANSTPSLERAIYASSRLVFEIGHQPVNDYDYRPSTPYGQSKIEGERIVRSQPEDCVPWVLIRPTSIWGPWFDIPYKNFFLSISQGRYIHPARRTIRKTFGFVGNVVHEIAKLAEAPAPTVNQKVFFVADYVPIDVKEWAQLIQGAMGAKPIKNAPYPLLKTLALVGDGASALGVKNAPLTSFRLNNLVTSMVYDMEPLKKVIGPLPYTLKEGVDQTVSWMKSARQI